MILSKLFTGQTHTEDTGRSQSAREVPSQNAAAVNRQIRSMVPGQTIQGEIVGRNGSEVQIKVSEDMVLQARVDRNLNLEIGKNMTFEVRNNGSSLTLSPLFTNVSTDVTVLKAIDMAGLPVNDTTVDLTSQLMQAGLSVNKNILGQVYRQVMNYPEAEVSDIVNLHKLGIPVNESTVNQMISYRNLTHQLTQGMDTVFQAIPEALEGMLSQGDVQGAAGVYRELFALFAAGEDPGILPGAEGLLPGQEAGEAANIVFAEQSARMEGELASLLSGDGREQISQQTESFQEGPGGLQDRGNAQAAGGVLPEGTGADTISQTGMADTFRASLAEGLLQLLEQTGLSVQEQSHLAGQIHLFAQGGLGEENFFDITGKLLQAAGNEGARELAQKLVGSGAFKELMTERLKDLWMLKPQDVAEPGKVQELYRRLDRQLKGLAQALENGGQGGGTAYRAVTGLAQNVDFLNQVNQMYAYVQIPLRLRQGDTNGELYVYTNKKNLASREGKVSALLHLDMEHIGPLDVYVSMESSKVHTKFYVQDEEMLDFLGAHMDILTDRLKERGYDCACSMKTRGEAAEEKTENSGIGPLLQHGGGMLLSRQAFDVRT